jgi:hypothetical protein
MCEAIFVASGAQVAAGLLRACYKTPSGKAHSHLRPLTKTCRSLCCLLRRRVLCSAARARYETPLGKHVITWAADQISLVCVLACCCVCCAVLGQAQKQLLDDEKREYLWKVLEMARGNYVDHLRCLT